MFQLDLNIQVLIKPSSGAYQVKSAINKDSGDSGLPESGIKKWGGKVPADL